MKIRVEGMTNNVMRKRIEKMIKDNEIRTWEFIEEDGYKRLMHNCDDQYKDVVLRFLTKKEENYVIIEPKIKDGIDKKEEKETAESHFGIVMGRFAELLNCHFPQLGSYKTFL